MTIEIEQTTQANAPDDKLTAAPPGSDNPMLNRNNPPDAPNKDGAGLDETNPAKDEVKPPEAPETPFQRAAGVADALSYLAYDPQLRPVGDYLLHLLGDKVDQERAFGNAIKLGDSSLIDTAYLTDVLGADGAKAAELAKGLFGAVEAKASAAVNEVFSAHGGEATVRQAVQFYNAKASGDERSAMTQLLNSGNKASIAYAMKQIMSFATSAGGVRVQGPGALPVGQPSAQRGLSASEYQKQVGEAHAKRAPNAEFDRLLNLRKLGRQQGL